MDEFQKGSLLQVIGGNADDPNNPEGAGDFHYFRMGAVVEVVEVWNAKERTETYGDDQPEDTSGWYLCRPLEPQPNDSNPWTGYRYATWGTPLYGDDDDARDDLRGRHVIPYVIAPLTTVEEIDTFLNTKTTIDPDTYLNEENSDASA